MPAPGRHIVSAGGGLARPPLEAALATFGIDRVLFSTDYPFAPNTPSKAFLNGLQMAPIDLEKQVYGNADRGLDLV